MTSKTLASLALILTALTFNTVEARTYQTTEYDRHNPQQFGARQTVSLKVAGFKQIRRKHERRYREKPRIPKNYATRTKISGSTKTQIVAHPAGCPRTRFCGCGTSLYLLGKVVREGGLAVAKNWLNFPRAACAPRMAAARRGHVFAIIKCLGDNKALVYDPNGGRHKTYIHVRDLSHYAIVNPHGRSRYAAAQ